MIHMSTIPPSPTSRDRRERVVTAPTHLDVRVHGYFLSHDSRWGDSARATRRASHPGVQRIRDETVRGDFRAMRQPLRVNVGVNV